MYIEQGLQLTFCKEEQDFLTPRQQGEEFYFPKFKWALFFFGFGEIFMDHSLALRALNTYIG